MNSKILLVGAMLLMAPAVFAKDAATDFHCRALIPEGKFTPLFGLPKNQTEVKVKSFQIDCDAVTVKEFDKFLQKHQEWTLESVPALFADDRYLTNYDAKRKDPKQRELPVVYVSWFAADAYCQSQGGRLPSTFEWERVAAANEKKDSAQDDSETARLVLEWYAKPSTTDLSVHNVALKRQNIFGVRGIHGVIWEWTSDFGSFRMTKDNRQQGDDPEGLFCGAAANDAENRTNYAAFMRYALRSSLEGTYSLPNLGFRCAYDVKK